MEFTKEELKGMIQDIKDEISDLEDEMDELLRERDCENDFEAIAIEDKIRALEGDMKVYEKILKNQENRGLTRVNSYDIIKTMKER